MKLSNKNSYLTNQSEGKARNRKLPKLTQLLYIVFVILLFGYIIYLLVFRTFMIKTDGVVEVEKYRLAATYGGKIESLRVTEGQSFQRGQTIAIIGAARYCSPPEPDPRLSRLTFQITDEEIKLRGLIAELNLLNKQQAAATEDTAGIRRALELNAPLLTEQQSTFDVPIQQQTNEIALQRLTIQSLKDRLESLQNIPPTFDDDPRCVSETITAPFDGYVYSVSLIQNEVSNRGETILTVVDNEAAVSVELYLDNDLYSSAELEHAYTVTFPDGTESEARVAKVNTSAITQSEREWKGYDPVLPKIKAHLVPEQMSDIPLWKKYDRYQVKVKGAK